MPHPVRFSFSPIKLGREVIMPLYKLSDTPGENPKKKLTSIAKKAAGNAVSGFFEPELSDSESEGNSAKAETSRRRKKIDQMDDMEQLGAAKDTALNILSMVSKTRKQLFDRLLEKGYREDIANAALDRLAEVGVVDDLAFARAYASSRHSNRGLAPYAIKRELSQKGIPEEMIDSVLEDFDEEEVEETALGLAISKAKTVKGSTHEKVKKVASAVARKGYSSAIAFKVAKHAVTELDSLADEFYQED
jgi:regulatory protein